MTAPVRLEGLVVDFDEGAGLGQIAAEESAGAGPAGPAGEMPAARYRFHCTQIADGSRAVAPGTRVAFRIVAGHGGQWEAAGIRPVRERG